MQQEQSQLEKLQSENIRLKAEVYDIRSAAETQIRSLQSTLGKIAEMAGVEPDETGNLTLDSILAKASGLIELGLTVEGNKPQAAPKASKKALKSVSPE